MIDRALLRVWGRIGHTVGVPAASLVMFRWLFGAYLLLFDARHHAWIDRAPEAFFNPPVFSLPYLVGGFPPAPTFLLLDIVGIVAIWLMMVGWRPRLSTTVVLVTLVLANSFGYSFGKISHQIAAVVVLVCMIIANWGQGIPAKDGPEGSPEYEAARRRKVERGLALLAVALAFGFLTAGIDKARHWASMDVSESGILSWYYPRMFEYEGYTGVLTGAVPGIPPALLKVGDWAAVLMEMSGVVALFAGRVPWRLWLLAATFLHLANALLLNITFATQALIYLAFVSLVGLARLRPWLSRLRVPAAIALAGVALWHIWVRVGEGSSGFFLWDGRSTFAYDLYVCVTICLVVAALIANDVRRELAGRRRLVRMEAQGAAAMPAAEPTGGAIGG